MNLPKRGKPRKIDMRQGLSRTLKQYIEQHTTSLAERGTVDDPVNKGAWLFPAPRGEPLAPDTFRKEISKPLFNISGFTYVNPIV